MMSENDLDSDNFSFCNTSRTNLFVCLTTEHYKHINVNDETEQYIKQMI